VLENVIPLFVFFSRSKRSASVTVTGKVSRPAWLALPEVWMGRDR
jgi:hypothetical protein